MSQMNSLTREVQLSRGHDSSRTLLYPQGGTCTLWPWGKVCGRNSPIDGSIWRNGDVNDTLRRVRWDKIHRFPEQIPEHCSHDHGGANAPQHAMILWAPDGRRSQFGITWPSEMRKEVCSAETKPVQSMVHKKSPLNRNGSFLSKSFAYCCYQYNVINSLIRFLMIISS